MHEITGVESDADAPLVVLLAAAPAFAQGSGSAATLTGGVTDPDGGVIPGATVEVKNNATGVAERVYTNTSGVFLVPALSPGTYTVTVSLQRLQDLRAERSPRDRGVGQRGESRRCR